MYRRGFTLVELSIVLVIIGLLIGGILVAQSMIETARLTRFITQIQQYQAAIILFKSNYNSLPGDSDKFTPAGNNDGQILGEGGSNDLYSAEMGNFWYHMTQAGMLEDQYAGTGASTGVFTVPANTMPSVDYGKGGKIVVGYSSYEGFLEPLNYENVLWIIKPPSQSRFVEGGAGNCSTIFSDKECDFPFTPLQAKAYDLKVDDGMPAAGNVWATTRGDMGIPRSDSYGPPCVDTWPTGDYKVSETQRTCALIMRMFNPPE